MTPTTILHAVCQVFPVTPADITGPRRRRNEADARSVTAAILYDQLRMNNYQIGKLLNHATASVPYQRERHLRLMEVDQQYRRMVGQVTALLGINQEIAA